MEPVRAALIGCGNISDAYLQMAPRFEGLDVIACADLVPAAAAAKAEKYGIAARGVDELLGDDEVELIINLTVPNAHAQVSIEALSAGKHVYSEKPLAVSLADARNVAAAAQAHGLRLGCAPDTFLGGGHQRARRLVDDGAIGRIIGATATFLSPGMESWHPNPEFFFRSGGGPLLDVGPYYVAVLVNLIGPVRRVSACSVIGHAERTITSAPFSGTKIKVEVPTHVVGTLEFESGALTSFTASWDVRCRRQDRVELYGAHGALIVPDPNFFGESPRLATTDDAWEEIGLGDLAFAAPNFETQGGKTMANYRIIGAVDMAWAIRNDRPHRANGEFALHVLEVLEAMQRSAESGAHVEIGSHCERPAQMPDGQGEDVFA